MREFMRLLLRRPFMPPSSSSSTYSFIESSSGFSSMLGLSRAELYVKPVLPLPFPSSISEAVAYLPLTVLLVAVILFLGVTRLFDSSWMFTA